MRCTDVGVLGRVSMKGRWR